MYVSKRAGMRNITMRWKGESLYTNAPRGVREAKLRSTLDNFRVKLRASRDQNTVAYHIGQVIQCYGFTLTIEEHESRRNSIMFRHSSDNVAVLVPKGLDLEEAESKQWLSKALKLAIKNHAQERLIPLAQAVAERVGVAPKRFVLGRGVRKLGHCTPGKVIQLSRSLMFLPEELIELTICHELAHLTHMNHSPQFHALVNQYTDGHEKDLEQQLRHFPFPILK